MSVLFVVALSLLINFYNATEISWVQYRKYKHLPWENKMNSDNLNNQKLIVCNHCGYDTNPATAKRCVKCAKPLNVTVLKNSNKVAKAEPKTLADWLLTPWMIRLLSGLVFLFVSWLIYCAFVTVSSVNKSSDIGVDNSSDSSQKIAPEVKFYNSMKEVPNVPSGLFNYGGAHTFAPLTAYGMNDAISRAHPEFRLRYTEPFNSQPGSGTGIKMLINGELSLAQSARPLEENDHQKAKALGFSLEQVPIGIDGVTFYTHPNLTIPGLSIDQLQAIFRGKVTNWQQVGGPNLPIVPVALNPKITSVLKLLLGGEGNDIGSNVQIVRDYTTAIRKVTATPGAIAYGSAPIFANQKSIRPIALAKANTKQYVQPYTENRQVNAKAFLDGTYPMTRRLFIVLRRDRSVDEKAAIAYTSMLLSREGQKIVEQAGFVPIR